MKELLEYLARLLVDLPDQVEVRELQGEHNTLLELRVAPDDMGKVIGRGGKTAQAIRTLTKAAGTREGKRITEDMM